MSEGNKRVHVTISIPEELRRDYYIVRDFFKMFYGSRITWESILRLGIDCLLAQKGLTMEAVRREITEIEEAKKRVSKP